MAGWKDGAAGLPVYLVSRDAARPLLATIFRPWTSADLRVWYIAGGRRWGGECSVDSAKGAAASRWRACPTWRGIQAWAVDIEPVGGVAASRRAPWSLKGEQRTSTLTSRWVKLHRSLVEAARRGDLHHSWWSFTAVGGPSGRW